MVTASMTPYYRQSDRRLNNEFFRVKNVKRYLSATTPAKSQVKATISNLLGSWKILMHVSFNLCTQMVAILRLYISKNDESMLLYIVTFCYELH